MQKFELVIKNDKVKQYRILALLIILINIVFFIWLAISNREYRYLSLFTIGLITAGFLAQYFTKKYPQTGAAALFIILFYFQTGYWQVATIITLLSILYAISIRVLLVTVNERQISYPSFPKKMIAWSELNNIVLKDGLLTIDFKNNRLAQLTVINDENDYDLDEKEFNEFCKMQLTR